MRIALLTAGIALAAVLTISAQEIVYTPGDGVTLPRPTKEVRPEYTQAPLTAGIQGTVVLEVVVLADGKVGDVPVTESLDSEYGLDRQALEATKQWEFTPGAKDGKPVAVGVQIELRFTLK
ncbi:MAG TPA: energy transducer TonB [Vicinamibacterales bacterium]|nr:energy transducer TonB [Vicinamibacterales bacterium]